jgi:curved DNA-binding protein CbpA
MGVKALYTDTKAKIVAALKAANDIEALAKLDKDKQAYLSYAKQWNVANLDEYISEFKITNEAYNIVSNKRKISFFDNGKEYEIVCAVGASYFRVQRKSYVDSFGNKHGDVYVTLDLKEPKIDSKYKGKEATAERNRLTHFRMTYKSRRKK